MQNKRGISQAFPRVPDETSIRRADVFDVFDISRVLNRSIVMLCTSDHENDPQKIADWTANKDPETVRSWVLSGAALWVAEHAGRVAAVGGSRGDEITLLYVDPDATGRGLGVAMLHRLEQELIAAGHSVAHLEATRSALGFYRRRGWQETGACASRGDVSCLGMRKSLHLAD